MTDHQPKWDRVAELIGDCVAEATPERRSQAARALEGYVREFPNTFVQFLRHPGTARLLLEIEEASGADVGVAILGKDSL